MDENSRGTEGVWDLSVNMHVLRKCAPGRASTAQDKTSLVSVPTAAGQQEALIPFAPEESRGARCGGGGQRGADQVCACVGKSPCSMEKPQRRTCPASRRAANKRRCKAAGLIKLLIGAARRPADLPNPLAPAPINPRLGRRLCGSNGASSQSERLGRLRRPAR